MTPSATASRGEISRVLPFRILRLSARHPADTGNPVIHIIHQGKGASGLFSQVERRRGFSVTNIIITKDITTLWNHLIDIIENSPSSNHILLIFIEK